MYLKWKTILPFILKKKKKKKQTNKQTNKHPNTKITLTPPSKYEPNKQASHTKIMPNSNLTKPYNL